MVARLNPTNGEIENLEVMFFSTRLLRTELFEVPSMCARVAALAIWPQPNGPALSLPSILVIRSVMGTEMTVVCVTLVGVMTTISG